MTATATLTRPAAQSSLSVDEFAEELDWLLSGGVHPDVAAKQLGTASHEAILRRLRRGGHDALADRFIEITESSRRTTT